MITPKTKRETWKEQCRREAKEMVKQRELKSKLALKEKKC